MYITLHADSLILKKKRVHQYGAFLNMYIMPNRSQLIIDTPEIR